MACFRRTHRRSGWTSLNLNAIKPELRALSSTTRNPRSSDQPEADFNDIHVSPAFRMPIGMAWHTPADVATELPGLRVQEREREPTYLYSGYGNNSFRVEIDAIVLSFCLSAPVWPVLARACCLARGGGNWSHLTCSGLFAMTFAMIYVCCTLLCSSAFFPHTL